MTVWKDYNCSQTSTCQTTVRGKLFSDIRWSDMKCVGDHGPEMHEGNSRCPMMGLIEQDHRKGKVAIAKKKVRGMWSHKEWTLCGAG